MRPPSHIAGLAVALVSAAAAVWYGMPLVVDTLNEARDQRSDPAATRRLAPAYSLGLDPIVLIGSARVLPPDARYAVVVGDTLPLPGALGEAVVPLLRNWLLPRRFTTLDEAEWVIAYGHPIETLDVSIRREVGIAPGVSVAELER